MFQNKCWLTFIFWIEISASLFSQVNFPFTKHLDENGLNKEQYDYIINCQNRLPNSSDTIQLLFAKYYLKVENLDEFFQAYEKCKNLFSKDTMCLNFAAIYFLRQEDSICQRWFNQQPDSEISSGARLVKATWAILRKPSKIDESLLPDNFRYKYNNYLKYYNRRALNGAIFSFLLPQTLAMNFKRKTVKKLNRMESR